MFATFNDFTGSYTVFDGKNGPTLRCLYPQEPKENIAPGEGECGILTGLISSFQASEVFKLITGAGESMLGKHRSYNMLTNAFEEKNIQTIPANLAITSILEKSTYR
ncbi:MAG: hypothetical protein HC896_18145 [Bacteroidales bacterium]|nr:hypothetical protein [Bacteroidales bacterium]